MRRALTFALAAAASAGASEKTRPRVAVCLWGVNRSLDLTRDSLRERILEPLAAAFDVFKTRADTQVLRPLNSEAGGAP